MNFLHLFTGSVRGCNDVQLFDFPTSSMNKHFDGISLMERIECTLWVKNPPPTRSHWFGSHQQWECMATMFKSVFDFDCLAFACRTISWHVCPPVPLEPSLAPCSSLEWMKRSRDQPIDSVRSPWLFLIPLLECNDFYLL